MAKLHVLEALCPLKELYVPPKTYLETESHHGKRIERFGQRRSLLFLVIACGTTPTGAYALGIKVNFTNGLNSSNCISFDKMEEIISWYRSLLVIKTCCQL